MRGSRTAPNPRLQRTRSAPLRSPLSRKMLGAPSKVFVALVLACGIQACASRPLDNFGYGDFVGCTCLTEVHVDTSGTVSLNGQSVPFESLRSELAQLKAANCVVWYSQADLAGDPPPHATEVRELLVAERLLMRMSDTNE